MNLFDDLIDQLHSIVDGFPAGQARRRKAARRWPDGAGGSVVLRRETAVELGSPDAASVACVLWTGRSDLVKPGRVTLIGPDLVECDGSDRSFAKVVLLEVRGFDEEACCERHLELELLRCDLRLDGYMLRAAPQHRREWSRVSRAAVDRGQSLFDLGASLIALYRGQRDVLAAEVLLVTSSAEDVRRLEPLSERAARRLAALDKRSNEREPACDSCEYTEVCAEVEGLRRNRHEACNA